MTADTLPVVAELQSADVQVRRDAARKLGTQSEFPSPVIVALVAAAGDVDDEVAEWANSALESCGPAAAEECSALIALADDADADKAWWAVTILGRMRQSAEPAIPTLLHLLKQCEETNVRQRAAWALGKIGADSVAVVNELQAARRSGDPRLSRLAEEALQDIPGS